jgi:hypothetical protein
VADWALLKSCVGLFEAMGLGCLVAEFEDKLLQSTKEYYARKSSEWIDGGESTPAYMVKAEHGERRAHVILHE